MTSFFLFIQRRFVIVLLLMLMAIAGLSGCMSSSALSKPVACTPNPTDVNIYKTVPQTWTNTIFQYAVSTPLSSTVSAVLIPLTGDSLHEQQVLGARYGAFQYLINETKRWSDTETIKLDDSSEAQITITFISPGLLQSVFLSEVLKHEVFFSDFESQTQKMLNSVAARDELLFLLTITTTTNNGATGLSPHTLDVPIKQMELVNSADLRIAPEHDDHNLDQPIKSSSNAVFGYLAYPLAVLTDNECKWVLEPKYNTNIVITVPIIHLDGIAGGPYTWTIPYSSLIHVDIPVDPPMLIVPPGFDRNQISSLAVPPSGINQTNNWQDFARFVWGQIMLGNY
jgi:hypothetical protein